MQASLIIDTCCVTKNSITKDRQILTCAKKENLKAKVVLTGCFPKKDIINGYQKDLIGKVVKVLYN